MGQSPSSSSTTQLTDCDEQEVVLVGMWVMHPFAHGWQGDLQVEQMNQDQMMVNKDIHKRD